MSESGSTRRPLLSDPGPRDPSHASATLPTTDLPSPPDPSAPESDRTVISSGGPIDLPAGVGANIPIASGKLLEGERLGPLILKEYVGGGGMGAVFRALDTTLNRDVAVKLLSGGQARDEETLRRFKNEAQSAARLDHDNIARVYNVGEDRGVHFIVFEFIEGVNIRDLVESHGPLNLEEAVSFTLQIAEALAHASQRDVIHRDIKPSNVLITPDGKAKLVDMGLARLQQVRHAENDLTVSGVTLGTFDYISPEQARDPRSADVRSDIYSLGCSFYYMLTGRPPFPEGTVLQKLLQHQADHPPDPREIRPELPAEIAPILSKMLTKNPDRRYQQPAELIQDLLAFADRIGLQVGSSTALLPLARPGAEWRVKRHLPWLVPLVSLSLIVPVLDFVWSKQEGNDSAFASLDGPVASVSPSSKGNPATHPPSPADGSKTVGPMAQSESGTQVAVEFDPTKDALAVSGQLAPAALSASISPPPMSAELSAPVPTSAAGTAETAPPSPTGTSPPGEQRQGVLVVSDTEEGDQVFRTLAAACSRAKSGDRIELRFNGRREETPFHLGNAKLTIAAAGGFQPVVVFRPADPLRYPRSMLTVAGGQLNFVNVHLEFNIGEETADRWALFELRRVELLRFERCSLTIRNAKQRTDLPSAAFFDVRAAGGGETMTMGSSEDTLRNHYEDSLSLEMTDCIVRGEASLIRTDPLQPVKFTWNNGLLALTGRLLVAEGGADAPRLSEQIQLQLRHVTADARGGLVRLSNQEDAPYQLDTDIKCTDSIFVLSEDAVLIEQAGVSSTRDLQSRVNWNGERNFYDGFEAFWKITSIGGGDTLTLRFDQWCAHWGDNKEQWPTRGPIQWVRNFDAPIPMHLAAADSYALTSNPTENPAHGGASDGSDAGVRLELLPEMPPDMLEGTTAEESDLPMEVGR